MIVGFDDDLAREATRVANRLHGLAGQPIPALPTTPHPGDLLTDAEVAAVTGLSASTVRADAVSGLLDPGMERHGRRWWTRTAAEAHTTRPTQYKGRTPGAKDRAPRRTAADPRLPEVVSALAAVETGQGPAVTPASLADRYQVSTRTAERLIAKDAPTADARQTTRRSSRRKAPGGCVGQNQHRL